METSASGPGITQEYRLIPIRFCNLTPGLIPFAEPVEASAY